MIAAVVLAAGGSSRMGKPKLLLAYHGKPLLLHVVDAATASQVGRTVVVLGYGARDLRRLLFGKPVEILLNRNWPRGLSTSVKCGLAAVSQEAEAVLFLLADQPLVTSEIIDRLIEAFQASRAAIVAPTYQGRRGNPVLYSREMYPALEDLQGDQGGRALLETNREKVLTVKVASAAILRDVDTPEDYLDL